MVSGRYSGDTVFLLIILGLSLICALITTVSLLRAAPRAHR